jgi:hypothetical protein
MTITLASQRPGRHGRTIRATGTRGDAADISACGAYISFGDSCLK